MTRPQIEPSAKLLKMAFFQTLQNKLLQITILNLKFEFPTQYS